MHGITKFLSGFKRFQQSCFCGDSRLVDELRQGQHPKVLMIACCDSRVDPALITDSNLGELFIVRNIANLVPPHEQAAGYHGVSSALEYAVRHLEVEHVVVLGHRQCGGIRALLEERDLGDEFINKWVNIAQPAKAHVQATMPDAPPEARERACEQAAVLVSLRNLMTFPWVRSRVEDGKLLLHGWYFDLEKGELLSYLPQTRSFEPLVSLCTKD
ncbi:MAG: carbonic anhydrase [Desulfovibrionaceae bacterium]